MLEPNIQVCIKTTNVTIKDITGRYNVTENPNGWGSPNIDYLQIQEAVVTITNLNTLNSSTYTVPTSNTSGTPEIIDLGTFDFDYEDGLYEVKYYLKDINNIEYNCCKKIFYMYNIDCCLDKLLLEVITKKEDDIIFITKTMKADAYRQALKSAALCMNNSRINYFINKLKLICNPCVTVK